MDIFAFALSREQDSEAFYRTMKAGCGDPGLQAILGRLADAEVRHQKVIRRMQDKSPAYVEEDPFLGDVKGAFTAIRDRSAKVADGMSQLALYEKAQGFEKESWELYEKAAAEAESEAARTVLLRLAGQEKMHYQILGTIIELVSRPLPGNWLENAEWYHLEEY
ncbi:MAG: ferritin family protein [Lentisphaeria bacterium]|nr:ferritin family protein [Lentisphaeria bacterium]